MSKIQPEMFDWISKTSYSLGMNAIVSEKGQVTIPKAVRDKLGLRPGTVLQFEATNGQLLGRKRVEQDVFDKWHGRGKLPGGLSVDEYLRRSRDDHGG